MSITRLFLYIITLVQINITTVYSVKIETNEKKYRPYLPPQSTLVIEYTNSGTKVLHQHLANERRHPASLTKIMTVYLLLEALQSKRVKPTTLFKVSKLASMQMPSKLNLRPGSSISVDNCIKALLVKSANDVAVVVAEGLAGSVTNFCKKMNAKAKSLGMTSTHFENPSGVPHPNQITCANDIAKLGVALHKTFPQYWNLLSLKSFTYGGHKYSTHCRILNWYKGSDGAKTGFINASGFNLWVTAKRYKPDGTPRRLFAVVFGGSSGKERDFKAARLMDQFFKKYSNTETKSNLIHNTQKTQPVALSKTPAKLSQGSLSSNKNTKPSKTEQQKFKSQLSTITDSSVTSSNTPSTKMTKPEVGEILYEIDSMPIEDIIESSGKSREYFTSLYEVEEADIDESIEKNSLNTANMVEVNASSNQNIAPSIKVSSNQKPIKKKVPNKKQTKQKNKTKSKKKYVHKANPTSHRKHFDAVIGKVL